MIDGRYWLATVSVTYVGLDTSIATVLTSSLGASVVMSVLTSVINSTRNCLVEMYAVGLIILVTVLIIFCVICMSKTTATIRVGVVPSRHHELESSDNNLTVKTGMYPQLLRLEATKRSMGEVIINYANGLVERQQYALDAGHGSALALIKNGFTPQISSIQVLGDNVTASLIY